ncbi:MAG: response regulator transcription factor [Sulfuritalea sp.]|nr:response regulator transcription factor [Sulfuritalea sp.]
MKVLLAEDDPQIGDGIARGLRLAGFPVDWVRDGNDADAALKVGGYALLILDLGLPGLDGWQLLEQLRGRDSTIPVLIVTARDAVSERVAGLNRGADDYLVKPFDFEELLARAHALLRRGRSSGRELRLGTLTVVPATRLVTLGEEEVELSAREFALLVTLMTTPGAVIALRELEERLYGWDEEVASNAVEVLIHRLRRKLGNGWIRNVRGVGYKIAKAA